MPRSGTIAIVGRPNVGKSTLLNRVCRAHLSIVSPRPQTTRVQVRGIVDHGDDQIVFVDTPGFDQRRQALSRAMLQRISDALLGADVVLFMTDVFPALRNALEKKGAAGVYVHPQDRKIGRRLREEQDRPTILVINKMDRLPKKSLVLPVIESASTLDDYHAIVPISARTGLNVDHLLDTLASALPEGQPLFPPDQITDRPERFFAAEIVRETAFHLLREEVPYAVAVSIEHWIEEDERLVIEARIIVEEESQKRIVVGKGGAMIKKIGTEARKRIQAFLDRRLHLGLRVVVRRKWSDDAAAVERLIETP